MKLNVAILSLGFIACGALAEEPAAIRASENPLPPVERVQVVARYIIPTGECFPERCVSVRFEGGRVAVEEVRSYPNREVEISEGVVSFRLGDRWGVCDATGQVVLAPRYEALFRFESGLAGVQYRGKYGFIDHRGEWVIPPQYDCDYTWDFIGQVCAVRINGKNAVIDRTGQFVWAPGLLRAENLAGGVFIKKISGESGFLDDAGRLIPDQKPNSRYFTAAETSYNDRTNQRPEGTTGESSPSNPSEPPGAPHP